MSRPISDPQDFPRLAAALGAALLVFGLTTLAAHAFGLTLLTTGLPGHRPISAWTGALFAVLGLALMVREWRPGGRGFTPLAALALLGALAVPLLRATGLEAAAGPALPTGKVSLPTAWALACGALAALLQGPGGGSRGRRQVASLAALGTLCTGALALLTHAAGLPPAAGLDPVAMSLPSSLAAVALAVALLGRGGVEPWPLRMFAVREAEGRRLQPAALAVFLTVILGLLALGTAALRREHLAVRRAAAENLRAVAQLKVSQVTRWRDEMLSDARVAAGSRLARRPFLQYLAGGPGAPTRAEMVEFLDSLAATSFQGVELYDAQGRPRCGSGDRTLDDTRFHQERLATVQGSREPLFTDLHLHDDSPRPRMSLWVPLGDGRPAGALLFRVDPSHFLYPRIQAWPGSSRTAETLLLREEQGAVLFLNELRHRPDSALRLRLPMRGHDDLLAVQALRGATGLLGGRDYRGEPVIGWAQAVPGTPWFLVAKQDRAELLAPLRTTLLVMALGVLGLGLTAALAVGRWVHRRDAARLQGRLEAEREARLQAQRFRLLLDQAREIILVADADLRIADANAEAARAYGRPLEALVGAPLSSLGTGMDHARLEALRPAGGGIFEAGHLGADGAPFPVEVSARWLEVEGRSLLLATVRDIRARRAEEVRIRDLTRLHAALGQIHHAAALDHTQGSLFQRVCELLVEVGPFELAWAAWAEPGTGEVVRAASHGDHQGYLEELSVRADDTPEGGGPVGTAIRTGRPALFGDLSALDPALPWLAAARRCGYRAAAGLPLRCQGRVSGALAVLGPRPGMFGPQEEALLVDAAGAVSLALDHLVEEQARQAAEAALAASEHALLEAQEAGQIGTFVIDLGTGAWRGSPMLDRILGLDEAWRREPAGWAGLVAPEAREDLLAHLQEARQRRQPIDRECPVVRPADGTRRWISLRGRYEWDAGGRATRIAGTVQDITARHQVEERQREMEAQLRQARRLESLGKLAGGVAHDMNNVLGAILSLASAHRARLGAGEPMAQALDTIATACERGRGVVRGLLQFARKDLEDARALDLNALVAGTVDLLAYTTLRRVNLEVDLEEGLPPILGDAGAIGHALMNICVNAVDAMGGTGTLQIRTCRLSDGAFRLSVRDDGPGMSAEVREKALEPFFTTKPQGEGTGLGLSMAFGTLQAHGGTLELISEPGRGTEVRMVFPPEREAPEPEPPPPAAAPADAAAGWRILLVDDDELIRESVGPMLEMLGHQVRTAPGGAEALRMMAEETPPDLVVLDMNMPGMNGGETLERILDRWPEQQVLMATGYTDLDLEGLLAGRPRVSSLRKPFSIDEISRKFEALRRG